MPRPAVVEPGAEPRTREDCSGIASLVSEDDVDERLNALFAVTDGPHGTIYILDADTIDGAAHCDDAHENPLWREILLHTRAPCTGGARSRRGLGVPARKSADLAGAISTRRGSRIGCRTGCSGRMLIRGVV
ncbi:hypothetical protein CSE45_1765 [Citreicella sp. SE45]|nr:hypothetical protein CSE45_1765 [Citreicella sp. SE45]